jgi:hypothetical protein
MRGDEVGGLLEELIEGGCPRQRQQRVIIARQLGPG